MVGWLIGFGVDDEAGVVEHQLSVSEDAGDSDFPVAFEDRVYSLGGRFVAILITQACARVYLDSCGSLSAVYSERLEIVCSSTALLPEDGGEWENHDLAAVLDVQETDCWYPFGLTPRLDARRLLPNHYLDLKTRRFVRHWPRQPIAVVADHEVARLVEGIANDIERLLQRLSEAAPVTLSLTAGRDSRVLLACSKPVKDDVDYYTDRYRDRAGRIDSQIARRLARAGRLRYRLVNSQQASDEELEEWMFRTGRCMAGRTWKAVRTARQTGLNSFNVTGHAGELGRAFYWKESDLGKSQLTIEELVTRLYLPLTPEILDAGQQWLEALPCGDVSAILDLLYVEQRVGCWASPQFYGHVAQKSFIVGFNHRRIIRSFLRLPIEYRYSKALPDALIQSRWPDLLNLPFNQLIGPLALADKLLFPISVFLRNRPRVKRILTLGKRPS